MALIIEDTDFASYADDNTLYVIADNIDGVIKSLEKASENLFKFYLNDNLMKINADNCHLLVSTNNIVKIKTRNFDITNSKREAIRKNSLLMIIFPNYVKRLVEKFMHCQE